MANINTTELISVLSKIQHNYTSLAQYWYDIFYNPEPKQVSVDYYDKAGNKVSITIDNLAKIKENIGGASGEGAPSPSDTPAFGTVYHDTESGDLYRYAKDPEDPDGGGVWDKIITSDIIDDIIIRNDDPLVNEIPSKEGTLYLSKDTHKLYIGRNATWERIDASPSLVNHFRRTVNTGDTTLVTNGIVLDAACENKNTMSIFVDGVYLNPSKYTIINNGFVVKFNEVLISPESNTIEIDIQYFTNLSLYEDYWEEEEIVTGSGARVKHKKFAFAKDLFDTLEDITTELNNLLVSSSNMEDTIDDLSEQIEQLKQSLKDAVAITVGDITQEVRAISDSVKSEKASVMQMHNSVKNWYDQVSLTKAAIDKINTNLTEDIDWLREVFTDPDTGMIDLRKFVFTEDFNNQMNAQKNDYITKINEVNSVLTLNINECSGELYLLKSRVATDETNIQANTAAITNIENNLGSMETSLREEFFSETNYPIGFFSTIKNNKYVYDAVSAVESDKYKIEISLRRDVPYYTIDLTEDLINNGEDKIYKYFNLINSVDKDEVERTDVKHEFSPKTGILEDLNLAGLNRGDTREDGSITIMSITYTNNVDYEREDKTYYPVGTTFNIPGYSSFSFKVTAVAPVPSPATEEDSYMVQARVTIRNNSEYRPRIVWANSNISWFGGEEPDFEAGKSYLVEFVSYDYGATWFAHTLGICQPTIGIGSIERVFDFIVDGYDESMLGFYCDVFYNKEDGKTYYAGTYTIDNGGFVKGVVLTFDKKELGDTFSRLRAYVEYDEIEQGTTFAYRMVENYNNLIDDEIGKETVALSGTNIQIDTHEYDINLVSDQYTDANYSVALTISQENNGAEATIDLAIPGTCKAENGTVYIHISSSAITNASGTGGIICPEAFVGASVKDYSTPWKVKSVRVTGGSTPLVSNTLSQLKLDGSITIYVGT